MKNKLKERKGITLIALVITIIVLLILAGISIGAITGDNGIIKEAKNAKASTEKANWEEQIDQAIISAEGTNRNTDIDDVIEELINKGVIDNENQVNTETGDITTNEPTYIISDKLNDYISNVKIIISKTPEIEMSNGVILKVEKVEGIEDGIDTTTMDETSKKEVIKQLDLFGWNSLENKNYNNFNELLQNKYNGNEEEYWNEIEEYFGNLDDAIVSLIEELNLNYTEKGYIVTNPDGEPLNSYTAFENKTYTFEVRDLKTGKIYKKSVEVTNVNANIEYKVKNYGTEIDAPIVLVNKNDTPTTFEEAYIFIKGKKIDITSCIDENNEWSKIDCWTLYGYLKGLMGLTIKDVAGQEQIFEIVKNGESYLGRAKVDFAV